MIARNRHIKLRRKRLHRSYEIGWTVRVYSSWFNHNDALTGWFFEGVIEKVEDQCISGKMYYYRVTKVVCDGNTYPRSWHVGTLGMFGSDSPYVFVLSTPTQTMIPMVTGKPKYR